MVGEAVLHDRVYKVETTVENEPQISLVVYGDDKERVEKAYQFSLSTIRFDSIDRNGLKKMHVVVHASRNKVPQVKEVLVEGNNASLKMTTIRIGRKIYPTLLEITTRKKDNVAKLFNIINVLEGMFFENYKDLVERIKNEAEIGEDYSVLLCRIDRKRNVRMFFIDGDRNVAQKQFSF